MDRGEILTLDKIKEFLQGAGKTLAQVAKRSGGCPISGSVQDLAGWELVEGAPAHGLQKVPSISNYSMIL